MAGLNQKQEAFALAYVANGFNATEAARSAGYAQPHSQGPRLLENVGVKARIAELTAPVRKKYEITAVRVLEEIAKVAFFNTGAIIHVTPDGDPYISLDKATENDFAAIAEAQVEDFIVGRGDDARDVRRVKVKAHDKLKALELLAKHMGLLKEVVEVTVDETTAGMLRAARLRAIEDARRRHAEATPVEIIDAGPVPAPAGGPDPV